MSCMAITVREESPCSRYLLCLTNCKEDYYQDHAMQPPPAGMP